MKTTVFINILLSILFLFPAGNDCKGQKPDKKLDALFSEFYPADEPGATVLVAKGGKVIYRKAFGMANLELDVPMHPEMVFEIGSITKQFTAASILMLMEEGKLSLDDEITDYIEDYPTHGHSITVHHLLTHTSGIRSYTSTPEIWEKARLDFKPSEIIDMFKNEPMDFAPGEKFLYNNSGYFLLGYIIEKVSGMEYAEFIEKRIFEFLGMKNSYYGSQSIIIPNRAYGYQKKEGIFHNTDYLSLTTPFAAGAIMTTVDDLLIWSSALHEHKLVSAESLDLAFKNYTLNNGEAINYGYGWFLNAINGSPTLEHGGGIFGYLSHAIYLPDEGVYISVLSNRDDKGPGDICIRTAAIAIEKPYKDENDAIDLDSEILMELIGIYEFEDGSVRYIKYEEGNLYSQRKGSILFEILPVSKSEFVYVNALATIEFSKIDDGGIEVVFENRNSGTVGKRISKDIPDEKANDESLIEVPADFKEQLVGEYVVNPGFSIKIFLEGENLMGQATNQSKFRMYPSSETRYYLKIVDAEIEFFKNSEGVYDSMILYQGGAEIKGKKK